MKYHYIVHATVVDPLPGSTYGTSPYAPRAEVALAWCRADMRSGKRSFVTRRDQTGEVVAVIPVFLTGAGADCNLSAEELEEIVQWANAGATGPVPR